MRGKSITLKEAAEKLNINYSTAKTIVQTFKKENRISKKPKHAILTKKSLKREQFLNRVLTQAKLAKIITRITSAELKKRKSFKEKLSKPSQAISEARTLAATGQASENLILKAFPRIESAGQMEIFEAEKEGPKPGQITRAVSVDMPQNSKKDIFYVHSEGKADEELNKLIDYEKLLELNREKMKIMETKKKEEIPKIEEFPLATIATQQRKEYIGEPKLYFDFTGYKTMIMINANKIHWKRSQI